HVPAKAYPPQPEAVRGHIAAFRDRVHGGAQFPDFVKTQRGTAAARSVSGKVKKEYVVLLVLQGRCKREEFSAARLVGRTKNDRGSGLQAWEKPTLAGTFPGHVIRQRLGMSWEILQIDFRVTLRGRNHPINQ